MPAKLRPSSNLSMEGLKQLVRLLKVQVSRRKERQRALFGGVRGVSLLTHQRFNDEHLMDDGNRRNPNNKMQKKKSPMFSTPLPFHVEVPA